MSAYAYIGKKLSDGMVSKKFRLYDNIMLDVLHSDNKNGDLLFEKLYRNNSIARIFSFLDEETTFIEELKIMLSFPVGLFISALWKRIF